MPLILNLSESARFYEDFVNKAQISSENIKLLLSFHSEKATDIDSLSKVEGHSKGDCAKKQAW